MLALESARALLEHGVPGLGLLDLPNSFKAPGANGAIQNLRKDFPQANILTAGIDVTDTEGVQSTIDDLRSRLGPITVLCCFAGMVHTLTAEDIPINEWKRVLDVNTNGTWFTTQAVGK